MEVKMNWTSPVDNSATIHHSVSGSADTNRFLKYEEVKVLETSGPCGALLHLHQETDEIKHLTHLCNSPLQPRSPPLSPLNWNESIVTDPVLSICTNLKLHRKRGLFPDCHPPPV